MLFQGTDFAFLMLAISVRAVVVHENPSQGWSVTYGRNEAFLTCETSAFQGAELSALNTPVIL